MSETRSIHYMTKEYFDSLNFPGAFIEELDKADKHLSVISGEPAGDHIGGKGK